MLCECMLMQAAAQAGAGGPVELDLATTLASFPPELREEVLLTADEDMLAQVCTYMLPLSLLAQCCDVNSFDTSPVVCSKHSCLSSCVPHSSFFILTVQYNGPVALLTCPFQDEAYGMRVADTLAKKRWALGANSLATWSLFPKWQSMTGAIFGGAAAARDPGGGAGHPAAQRRALPRGRRAGRGRRRPRGRAAAAARRGRRHAVRGALQVLHTACQIVTLHTHLSACMPSRHSACPAITLHTHLSLCMPTVTLRPCNNMPSTETPCGPFLVGCKQGPAVR